MQPLELIWKIIEKGVILFYGDAYLLYKHENPLVFIIFQLIIILITTLFFISIGRIKAAQKGRWKKVFGYTILFLALNFSSYFVLVHWGERLFLKLDEDKLGIILTDFEGVNEYYRFGPYGIRSKIESTMKLLGDPVILESVQIRFSNKSFKDIKEALEWRNRQRADILVWGFVEETTDSIIYHISYESKSNYLIIPSFARSDTVWFGLGNKQRIAISRMASIDSKIILDWIEAFSYTSLIETMITEKDYSAAIRYLNDFRERYQDDYGEYLVYYNLHLLHCNWELGNWEKCMENAGEVDRLFSTFEEFPKSILSANYITIANCFLNLGDTSKAIDSFYKSVEYDSSNVNAWKGLCEFLLRSGEYSNGLSCCEYANSLDSSDVRVMSNIGAALMGENRSNKAAEVLSRFYENNKEDEGILENLVLALFLANKDDSCLYYSNLCLNEIDDNNEKVTFFKILSMIRIGMLEESTLYLEQKIAKFPCLLICYYNLAQKYSSFGEEDKAGEYYEKYFYKTRKAFILDCVKKYGLDAEIYERQVKRTYDKLYKK